MKTYLSFRSFFDMPQVDNVVFLSIIFSLFKSCAVCYGFALVYLFYPFVSRIKIIYNFLSKLVQTKEILNTFFKKI